MLVSVSGSQGSGKSTIINSLASQGYSIIERKTSRSILSDWNTTLDEINDSLELSKKFQEEILRRKIHDESIAVKNQGLWFTERTYADLFTYAVVTLGRINQCSEWLNSYYEKCINASQTYDFVYYLRAGRFHVANDGVRGISHHYSRMVDLTMLDFTQQMIRSDRLTIIETPDLEQRISIIKAQTV